PSAGAPADVAKRQSLITRTLPDPLTSPLPVRMHRKRRSQRWLVVELADQLDHPSLDLVAGRANLLQRPPLRVLQLPVEVAGAGDVGALVAAAHRHHEVGPFGVLGAELVGDAAREVDAELAHRLDHLGVHALAGRGPGRARLVALRGLALEERLAHLRAAGVVQADEEDARHQAGCSPRTSW